MEDERSGEREDFEDPDPGVDPGSDAKRGEPVEDASTTTDEEELWGMLCHIAAFAGLVIPFGNIVGPLVIWLIKKDEMPFVDEHGKEAVNFNITVAIVLVFCFILTFLFIGILLLPILGIVFLIFTIIAAVKASNGESYEYPVSIPFVS